MATVATLQNRVSRVSTEFASLDAAVAALGASNAVLTLAPGDTKTLTGDLTIPANVTLDGRMGVIATNGFTLTINSRVPEVMYQVFDVTGGGSVSMPNTEVTNPRMFGAVGDASTDDTTSFRGALATGCNVRVPRLSSASLHYAVTGILDCSKVGQQVFGHGHLSKVVQSGTGSSSTVFRANNLGQNEFRNLYAVPGTTTGSTQEGFGFAVFNSDASVVEGCRVTGHRAGGIVIGNSDYCKVLDNWITDSVVDSVTDTQGDTGFDIFLYSACNYTTIRGNHCIDGCGVGIAIQTQAGGESANHNLIQDNVVHNQDIYGIMLYILGASDNINYTIISGNKIDTITGDIPQDGGLFTNGAGIYVQRAEHTLIFGNSIRNTNVRASPSELLVPAAIGIGTVENITVADNEIEDVGHWGIACIQSLAYTAAGRGLIITGNRLRNVTSTGIFLSDVTAATLAGNRIHGDGEQQGIRIRQITFAQPKDYVVANNVIEDFGVGIQEEGTIDRSHVHDNIVRGNTSHGILLSSTFANCHDNTVASDAGGSGIQIGATCVDGFCRNNYITGGTTGITDLGTLAVSDNQTSGISTPYNPSMYRVLANSAAPSVKNARFASFAFTTAVTNFNDAKVGQVLTLKALANFTLTHSAVLNLSGSANYTMASGDTVTLLYDGAWREIGRGNL